MTTLSNRIDLSITSNEEIQAQDLVKCGQIDQAIAIYQQLKPDSARVLNIIGVLYAQKKGAYDLAITYYERALQIQEKNGDDISDTLTELGIAYQNLREFDLALIYHFRALSIRQLTHNIDQKLVASSLLGIANAYWGQENLSEAFNYAQQALTLIESIESKNDLHIATNIAILANIYHRSGDDIRALELAKQALILLERCVSPDSPILASLLNNIGTIQVCMGLLNDALLTFIRVLHIYEKTLPKGHSKRLKIANNIQRITEMQRHDGVNAFSHLRKILPKILLL